MKRITTLVFLSLAFFVLYAGNLEFTYNFSAPSVKNSGSFQVISFENTFLTGKSGAPALPYQAVRLLLPPGEEAVAVTYRFENESILDGSYIIFPKQASHPVSLGSDGIFQQDNEIYSSKSAYPAQAWGEFSTHFMNGHSFLLATFTPLKYIPSDGKVSYFQKIIITVETRSTDRASLALNNLNTSSKIESRISALAQNPSMLSAYPSKSNREGEYQVLIITPQQFESYYQPLKDLYLVRGFKTEIVTSETINLRKYRPGPAGEDQELYYRRIPGSWH